MAPDERALEPQELLEIIDAVPDGVMILAADGTVLRTNSAALALLGRRDEVVGRPMAELVAPGHRAAFGQLLDRVFTGARATLEYEVTSADGEHRWIETHAAPLNLVRGATACFCTSHDVTDRKALQTRLLVAERMASVGTLAAGVAHEINNPLAYVTANLLFGFEELGKLQATGTGGLDEVIRALDEARNGADRVRRIVRDLKLFSRSEDELRVSVDVAAVLGSAVNMAANEIRQRARLVADYRNDLPPVEANEARLGQVFLNLLVNAAQAIPEGAVDQHEVAVAARTDRAGRVVVEVRDTGHGIAPEHLGRIFDPFFTTKPVGVGTGLGLAICQGIVSSLGGTLEVASTPGRGSTFRVTLPAADSPAAPRLAPKASGTFELPPEVLVVDDEPMILRAVNRILAPKHSLTLLSDAREALAKIVAGQRFDVILCDLMMPEMSGMDLHAELTRAAPDQAARMVFLTGGAFTGKAREFLDGVPNVRLDKPFDGPSLKAVIRDMLG